MGYSTCGVHGGSRAGVHCCDVCDACTACEAKRGNQRQARARRLECRRCCGPLVACSDECERRIREHLDEANGQLGLLLTVAKSFPNARGCTVPEAVFGVLVCLAAALFLGWLLR